jgi:hypothetical protein
MKITYSTEKINPFGGLHISDKVVSNSGVYNTIAQHLGERNPQATYGYSDIIRSLLLVSLSGGDCAEDLTYHLRPYLSKIKNFTVPGADTVLRAQKELATEKEEEQSQSGTMHEFNINMQMNRLLVRLLYDLGQLKHGADDYTFDYDNQFIPAGKYDAKYSYKKADGYFPGIASINNMPVYIENRNGNSHVKYKQAETLIRAYSVLEEYGIPIKRSRMDCGSFSRDIVSVVEAHSELFYIRAQRCNDLFQTIKEITHWEPVEIGGKLYEVASIEYAPFGGTKTYRYVISREPNPQGQGDLFTGDAFVYRAIMTNDRDMSNVDVILFYNARGESERLFDEMNNDFNWKKLPFSYLHENTVFMIIMAICRNIFHYLTDFISTKLDFVKPYYRLKKFIFRFITVPAKWIKRAREYILKLYTDKPYHFVVT